MLLKELDEHYINYYGAMTISNGLKLAAVIKSNKPYQKISA
jgi:hypothetical protein